MDRNEGKTAAAGKAADSIAICPVEQPASAALPLFRKRFWLIRLLRWCIRPLLKRESISNHTQNPCEEIKITSTPTIKSICDKLEQANNLSVTHSNSAISMPEMPSPTSLAKTSSYAPVTIVAPRFEPHASQLHRPGAGTYAVDDRHRIDLPPPRDLATLPSEKPEELVEEN